MNCVVVGGGVVVAPPLNRGHVTVVVGGGDRHGILGNSWDKDMYLLWLEFIMVMLKEKSDERNLKWRLDFCTLLRVFERVGTVVH